MKAKYLVILFGVLTLYFGVADYFASPEDKSNVANFAHLGGMVFGFILLQRWKQRR